MILVQEANFNAVLTEEVFQFQIPSAISIGIQRSQPQAFLSVVLGRVSILRYEHNDGFKDRSESPPSRKYLRSLSLDHKATSANVLSTRAYILLRRLAFQRPSRSITRLQLCTQAAEIGGSNSRVPRPQARRRTVAGDDPSWGHRPLALS